MAETTTRTARWRRYWDRKADGYDREMSRLGPPAVRRLARVGLRHGRPAPVLEVAVGTGLNLPFYPRHATLTGIDLSEGMLEHRPRPRRPRSAVPVTLRQGDAHALLVRRRLVRHRGVHVRPVRHPGHTTLAVAEMVRVLRPGGRLILVDHVASSARLARAGQWLLERITVPLAGEHFRRRPLRHVEARGLPIDERERFKLGMVERLVARKPGG